MLFTTTTQYVVLALLLVAGWFFGLASHPGGRKWRTRYEEERAAHAAYRREAEERQKLHDERVAALESRNRALEDERRAAAVATPAAVRAEDAPARGTWMGTGTGGDNLSRIRGIDGAIEDRLGDADIKTYRDIEGVPAADEAALEDRLGIARGSIARDQWKDQAALLAAGRDEEWRERFGTA